MNSWRWSAGEESAAATGRDGLTALALAEAAQKSHDTGRPVSPDPV